MRQPLRTLLRAATMTGIALIAVSCGVQEEREPAASAQRDTATLDSTTAADSARLIREDGIGVARAGMTIGDLRAALPPGHVLGTPAPFMVDIDAMPVVHGTDTLYHVLIVSGESSADDAAINLIATTDSTFRTAEGIGPGSTLAAAAAAYGAPTLSYNTSDESREYAMHPDAPRRLRFRVGPAGETTAFAGVYTDDGAEHRETTRYQPDARITMVIIHMR